MRLIFLLLVGFCLAGCATQERCAEKFPPTPFDSVHTTDVLVPDTITIFVPYQEVTFDTASPCDPKIIYVKEVRKGGLTGILKIEDGRLIFECKQDSLQKEVNILKHQILTTKSKREVVETIVEKPIPWYYSFYKYGFWALLLILLLITILLLIKSKINFNG